MEGSNHRKLKLPASGVLSHWFGAARRKTPGAVEELFTFYRPLLTFLAECRIRDALRPKVGASDLVQLTEWKAREKFAVQEFDSRQGFHAWLLTILDNHVADVGRRFVRAKKRNVSRERSLSSPDAQHWLRHLSMQDSSVSATVQTAEAMEQVRTALDRLPPHYRLVLKLRYFEMQSFQAIGDRIERPADAARMLHNRAIVRLRALLHHANSGQSRSE